MKKVYTSAVVIIPPQESWEPIQEIRKVYDRNIYRWMPHITLLYPFRPETDYNTLEKKFSEVCKLIGDSDTDKMSKAAMIPFAFILGFLAPSIAIVIKKINDYFETN